MPLGRKGKPLSEAELAVFNKKRSKSTQKKYDERKKSAKVTGFFFIRHVTNACSVFVFCDMY